MDAVAKRRFVVGKHARGSLLKRGVELRQIESGTLEARRSSVLVRKWTSPHPPIVVPIGLPDGTQVTVVWAWLPDYRMAKLVTVFFKV